MERQRLDKLISEGENSYTTSKLYEYQKQKADIDLNLNDLEMAKRHYAFRLSKDLEACTNELNKLPDGQTLSEIDSDIAGYNKDDRTRLNKETELNVLLGSTDKCTWAEKSLVDYRDLINRPVKMIAPQVWIPLIFTILTILIITGFHDFGISIKINSWSMPVLFLVFAVCMILVLIAFTVLAYRALKNIGTAKELERIKKGFNKRFGVDLHDIADLESVLESLRERKAQEKSLKHELHELEPLMQLQQVAINDKLSKFYQGELNSQTWCIVTKQIREKVKELKETKETLGKRLFALDIPEDNYMEKASTIEWDKEQYDNLVKKLDQLKSTIETERGAIGGLKIRMCQETNCQTDNWDELLNVLRDKREKNASDYKEITSEIVAKICTYTIVKVLQQEENQQIENGLKRPEIAELLNSITGHYKGIRLDTDGSLKLVTNTGEDFALSQLSTGAKEQIYLILRMVFASKALKDTQAFLIFDDAFQHSDWIRRPRLINEIFSLADKGWQVFYFTMDDHIRDLFKKEGEKFGSRFGYRVLN